MKLETLVLLFLTFSSAGQSAAQERLVVVVVGLKNNDGTVRVGLFDNETDYLKKPVAGRVASIKRNSATVVFENLQPGTYALSVIHDENGNEELDTNGIGIPREGFGFGNNAMGLFGPPSFKKASINLKDGPLTQRLRMRYF